METKDRDFSEIVEMPADYGKVEEAPAQETPPPESPPDETPEAKAEQPRGPDGKFASKEAKPEAAEQPKGDKPTEPAPPAAPVSQPKPQPDPGFVPIAALLDTRDKANSYKRQLDEVNAKLADFERQKSQQPPIDPYADFDGALNQRVEGVVTPLQKEIANLRFELMRTKAESTYGAEAIKAAEDALEKMAQENDPELPYVAAQLKNAPDPIGAVVRWHKQRTFDPEAERAKLREQLLAEIASKQPQAPTAAPETPPSMAALAQGGSNGKEQVVTMDGKFNTMFNR